MSPPAPRARARAPKEVTETPRKFARSRLTRFHSWLAASGRTHFDDAMATDAASPEEVLPAPPEVDASSDDRVDAGVTANPGESVAEVTLPRAEVEAPEAGQFASGAPRVAPGASRA